MKVRCLIVEDEPIARDLLHSYVSRVEHLDLIGKFGDAVSAGEFLRGNAVDLVFLDIKMPRMTGLELLRSLPQRPRVVIVSAYRDFAIDAYDLDVIDYLLKPITFERFMKAVDKAGVTVATEHETPPGGEHFFFVKSSKQVQKVYADQILFLESQRDYVKIRLTGDRDVTTRQTITYYEEFLPAQQFVRVHRSFIVAADRVSGLESGNVVVGNRKIPIGRHYKSIVAQRLKDFRQEGQ
jgi:DNA-binding LytR/AlgR family response regulator